MNITIKDEHCPNLRSFQIVAEGRILASNVSPAFAMWIADAASALEELRAKQGRSRKRPNSQPCRSARS